VTRSPFIESYITAAPRPSRTARRVLGALVALALLGVLALVAAPSALAGGTWRLEQPPPPAGAPFKVPLGAPGDLSFYAPNRGLLSVEGNATVARGLFFWNGRTWRQLSTVCGGPGDSSRIAWAGPDEFWTLTEPSLPRMGSGQGLCHFKDGQVVGSYSTPPQSSDPYRAMDSAACNGPNDCWFGGIGAQDPAGRRVGAFHLHWDGTSLATVYAPQGRGVSDIVPFAGGFYETTLVGVQREDRQTPVTLSAKEAQPRLIHRISGRTFSNSPSIPVVRENVPSDGTELLAADQDGSDVWFVGGGAASGPSAPEGGGIVPRPPVAIHLVPPFFQEVPIADDAFSPTSRFGDVAAVPGSDDAWVTVVPYADRASKTAKARVARIGPDGTVGAIDTLPASGAGRGSAARIAFTGPDEGWMVTQAGWVFHYTDGTVQDESLAPAFGSLITVRPNESAAQFIPDTPPVDDSLANAPPTIDPVPVPVPEPEVIPALLKKITVKLRVRAKGRDLAFVVRFQNRRKARIQILLKRKKHTVVKSKSTVYKPGAHTIVLPVTRKRYPDDLKVATKEPGQDTGDDGTVTTGGGAPTGTGTTGEAGPSTTGTSTTPATVRVPRSPR